MSEGRNVPRYYGYGSVRDFQKLADFYDKCPICGVSMENDDQCVILLCCRCFMHLDCYMSLTENDIGKCSFCDGRLQPLYRSEDYSSEANFLAMQRRIVEHRHTADGEEEMSTELYYMMDELLKNRSLGDLLKTEMLKKIVNDPLVKLKIVKVLSENGGSRECSEMLLNGRTDDVANQAFLSDLKLEITRRYIQDLYTQYQTLKATQDNLVVVFEDREKETREEENQRRRELYGGCRRLGHESEHSPSCHSAFSDTDYCENVSSDDGDDKPNNRVESPAEEPASNAEEPAAPPPLVENHVSLYQDGFRLPVHAILSRLSSSSPEAVFDMD